MRWLLEKMGSQGSIPRHAGAAAIFTRASSRVRSTCSNTRCSRPFRRNTCVSRRRRCSRRVSMGDSSALIRARQRPSEQHSEHTPCADAQTNRMPRRRVSGGRGASVACIPLAALSRSRAASCAAVALLGARFSSPAAPAAAFICTGGGVMGARMQCLQTARGGPPHEWDATAKATHTAAICWRLLIVF